MSYKNSLSKKVHKYTFLGLNLCFVLNISGLWNREVGVLCRGSTPEVQSAGYALGLAAWFARIMNYELLGWCCRAGRSTS